jgi:hypothetical protein
MWGHRIELLLYLAMQSRIRQQKKKGRTEALPFQSG